MEIHQFAVQSFLWFLTPNFNIQFRRMDLLTHKLKPVLQSTQKFCRCDKNSRSNTHTHSHPCAHTQNFIFMPQWYLVPPLSTDVWDALIFRLSKHTDVCTCLPLISLCMAFRRRCFSLRSFVSLTALVRSSQCLLTCTRRMWSYGDSSNPKSVDPRVHWECLRKCKQLKQSMMLSSPLS